MRKMILSAIALAALAVPALADSYPVDGKWGLSTSAAEGPIDCAGSQRVIGFNDGQRTDSKGSVPAYRNRTVTNLGGSSYRVVDEFSNAQVRGGRTTYTLRQTDANHIELQPQNGGTIKLQRCK